MLNSKKCADAWAQIVSIYRDTMEKNDVTITVDKIIQTLGKDVAIEAFATVAKIKEHDGRIYGENRAAMNAVEINPDAVIWSHANPMINLNLDAIHTSNINIMIGELLTR